jgi:hypothetical protein
MIIRTLRPCEVAGRTVPAGLLLDLPEHQANALVDAGHAELHTPKRDAFLAEAPQPAPSAAPATATEE